ncbi:hypothetical protein ZPAH1_orf00305 [Aeromonas phage ZPAH1]|nr:hypothetical protein ASwh1_257 [Aeromonas phage Aswh_1]QQG34067.1 hypothetical protein ZPAH1_orf00305 [Aeromonas phage ZPAH1]
MIGEGKNKVLDPSIKDLKESLDIVTDSMLTLDDKTEKLTKSTTDLTAAYDINSDASVSLSQEQEKLTNQIKRQRKTNINRDKVNSDLEKERIKELQTIQDSNERRKKLETILNDQQPLVDYSNNIPVEDDSGNKKKKPIPEETRETLEEFIKREVGDRDEFIENFKKENQKTGKFIREVAAKANIINRMKNSETSATAKILGHTMSAGMGMITGTIDNLLSSIPGYRETANATKFVAGSIYDAHKARKEKNLDRKAEKTYEAKKSDAVSKFQQIPTPGKSPTEEKIKQERDSRDKKKESDANSRERDANDKRHKGLMSVLKGLQMSMILGKLMSFIGPIMAIGGGLMAAVTGLSGSVAGIGAAVAAALGAVVGKMIGSMTDLFKKLPGFSGPKTTPTKPTIDPKTNKPTTEPPKNGKPNTPKPSGGPTIETKPTSTPKPGVPDAAGKAGKTAGKAGAGKVAAEAASKFLRSGGARKLAGFALKLGLRAIPFAGAALLAYDIYSAIKDNPEMVEKGMEAAKGAFGNVGEVLGISSANASDEPVDGSKLKPVIKSGEDQATSARIEEGNRKVEQFRAKQAEEERKREERRTEAMYASYNTQTYNSMTSVLPSGFGPYHPETPVGSYGVQPIS